MRGVWAWIIQFLVGTLDLLLMKCWSEPSFLISQSLGFPIWTMEILKSHGIRRTVNDISIVLNRETSNAFCP